MGTGNILHVLFRVKQYGRQNACYKYFRQLRIDLSWPVANSFMTRWISVCNITINSERKSYSKLFGFHQIRFIIRFHENFMKTRWSWNIFRPKLSWKEPNGAKFYTFCKDPLNYEMNCPKQKKNRFGTSPWPYWYKCCQS